MGLTTLLISWMLYWDTPTLREDGSEFYSNEVAFYEMYHNGVRYGTTELTEMDVQEYGDYKVRVIDIEGQVSEFSNTVNFTRVKGKPGAPGQLRKQR